LPTLCPIDLQIADRQVDAVGFEVARREAHVDPYVDVGLQVHQPRQPRDEPQRRQARQRRQRHHAAGCR